MIYYHTQMIIWNWNYWVMLYIFHDQWCFLSGKHLCLRNKNKMSQLGQNIVVVNWLWFLTGADTVSSLTLRISLMVEVVSSPISYLNYSAWRKIWNRITNFSWNGKRSVYYIIRIGSFSIHLPSLYMETVRGYFDYRTVFLYKQKKGIDTLN